MRGTPGAGWTCDTGTVPWEPLPGTADGEPQPLSASVERLLGHLGAPAPATTDTLVERWPELVGPLLAERSRPGVVRDGVVVVHVDDPAWVTQFRFSSSEILARIHDQVTTGITRLDVRVRRP